MNQLFDINNRYLRFCDIYTVISNKKDVLFCTLCPSYDLSFRQEINMMIVVGGQLNQAITIDDESRYIYIYILQLDYNKRMNS